MDFQVINLYIYARSKLASVLLKNRGYSTLIQIDSIINGEICECDQDNELSVENVLRFKHVSIVCDIERSFSKFKSMF